jgi:formate-dependent nitrite reductase membrane component NrfD
LVADLGQPSRFHHMMRVFKPSSPMNLGAWTLLAYSVPVTFLSARTLLTDGADKNLVATLVPAKSLSLAGIPLALIMTSYPGVLLSTTSTPVWSKSRFLGALLACSSINTAVAACSLHLEVHGGSAESRRLLRRLETVTSICEAGLLATYLVTAKEAAQPLTKGRYRWHFWLGAVAGGMLAPIVLQSNRKLVKTTRSVLTLLGGLALKWSLTHAGRESAIDIHATHKAAAPTQRNPGWKLEQTTDLAQMGH